MLRFDLVILVVAVIFVRHGRSQGPPPNIARSVLLTDAVDDGARCLDGSPVRFWLQTSNSSVNSTKWSFHLMGGGNCGTLDDCAARAYAPDQCYRGSSSVECFNANSDAVQPFADTMDFLHIPCCNGARWCGGLMTSDPVHNPLTWDWNKVLVQYCDGGMWVGSNESITMAKYNGSQVPLYFRGMRNVDAVLSHLLRVERLASATELVLGGDSAGGMGVFWLADHFRGRLEPHGTHVVAVPDSGFFFDDRSLDRDVDWPSQLAWTIRMMNGTAGLNQNCVASALASLQDPSLACTLPEDVAPFIRTPLFVLNSRYDPEWAAPEGVKRKQARRLGRKMVTLVKHTVLRNETTNGAFITSCNEHCGQWSQGQHVRNDSLHDDYNVSIDGWSAASAVNAWHGNLVQRRFWLQDVSFPCHQCCQGGVRELARWEIPSYV